MGQLLSYSLFSGVILSLCYLVYKWILASENQHSFNRLILYLIISISLLMPFIINESFVPFKFGGSGGPSVTIGELEGYIPRNTATEESTTDSNVIVRIFLWIYFIGMIITTGFSIFGIIQIRKILNKGKQLKLADSILVLHDDDSIAPFSWIKYIVISRKDYAENGEAIFIHERRHLDLLHWIDMSISQLLIIFQWYNPASWLIREEFRNIHEYQADEAVLLSGVNAKEYQLLLIKKTVGKSFHTLVNSLNHSKLKKRVTMMYKEKSSKTRRLSAFLLLPAMALGCVVMNNPAVAGVLHATSSATIMPESDFKISEKIANEEISNVIPEEKNQNSTEITGEKDENLKSWVSSMKNKLESEPVLAKEDVIPAKNESTEAEEKDEPKKVFVSVEKLADFPGGQKEMMNFVMTNLRYPEEAQKQNIQGSVVVKFVVGEDGKVSDAVIVRGIHPLLDEEALRVIQSMPAWVPATVDGKNVASYYNLPLTFMLKESSTKEGNNDK